MLEFVHYFLCVPLVNQKAIDIKELLKLPTKWNHQARQYFQ